MMFLGNQGRVRSSNLQIPKSVPTTWFFFQTRHEICGNSGWPSLTPSIVFLIGGSSFRWKIFRNPFIQSRTFCTWIAGITIFLIHVLFSISYPMKRSYLKSSNLFWFFYVFFLHRPCHWKISEGTKNWPWNQRQISTCSTVNSDVFPWSNLKSQMGMGQN